MNEPKVQKDIVPARGVSPALDPEGRTPLGIPEGLVAGDPMAAPTDDRLETETATLDIAKSKRRPPGP